MLEVCQFCFKEFTITSSIYFSHTSDGNDLGKNNEMVIGQPEAFGEPWIKHDIKEGVDEKHGT